MRAAFEAEGFALFCGALDRGVVARLTAAIDEAVAAANAGRRHALRNLAAKVAVVREFIGSMQVRAMIEPLLGNGAFAVRSIYFDKVPGANWKVAWHQDLSVAVKERRDVEGFGPWSVKEGVHHVEPPVEVLERMVTLRIHLDDCGEENGPLRVIPGSHRDGRLTPQMLNVISQQESVTRIAHAGDVLAMRPLLVHSSSASQSPRHRRVVHIEFASEPLPDGLEWYERISLRQHKPGG